MYINYSQIRSIENTIKQIKPNCKFLFVTKTRPVNIIDDLIKAGYRFFGENRVQEAKNKYSSLSKEIELHLIGPLQTNKTKEALRLFDVIQTLDRKKIVLEIVKQKALIDNIKTNHFYIQVNIGDEPQKSGVKISETKNFYNFCLENKLEIKGLMCIPPNTTNPEFFFQKLKSIRNDIDPNLELSMGMSGDYIDALSEGSDMIRIGSLIFKDD